MATMAPATFDIELETEMTGWMGRKGIRYGLVILFLTLARYFSRSRVTIRGVPKSKGFREQLAMTAGVKQSRCSHSTCPGVSDCPMCPARSCARCEASGIRLNDSDGVLLCDGCTDEVLNVPNLDSEIMQPLDEAGAKCERCLRKVPFVTWYQTERNGVLRWGLMVCGSCEAELSNQERPEERRVR